MILDNSKVGEFTGLNFKTYYKATVMKIVVTITNWT